MDTVKMILDYALAALSGGDVDEAKIVVLRNAQKLIEALPSYVIDDALKALFKEEENAESD